MESNEGPAAWRLNAYRAEKEGHTISQSDGVQSWHFANLTVETKSQKNHVTEDGK